ncbi:Coenzyme F420-reducing hydrogenase, beta subunit [Hespellia stercorisuis DSM 15480]|uniref:Coenzyme F420-reducing hydrogenase, beta subunit n=1 Tax=Hespellia stercorisuis DSM 15480 TaxID=1121950 RepID=A0A1M6JY57_9FIRM|nr:Coenzyme F420-reducing hydrogenase, beta subunit [Hespellia stercorisuis DSM 15480]
MISLASKAKCTGCAACADSCPKNCIEMKYDNEGFLFPSRDTQKCVECHMCERSCPIVTDKKVERTEPQAAYAAKHLQKEVCGKSSSGGAFAALAKVVLEQNGVVFAAGMDSDFHVYHSRAATLEELKPLLRAKYLQSNMTGIYRQIKEALETGVPVLFVGTPCQARSVKLYFGDATNLYTGEFICHGVPSQAVFAEHIRHVEKKTKARVKKYDFHTKRLSWRRNTIHIQLDNGKNLDTNSYNNPFLYGFFKNKILRRSCYDCQMRTVERTSDIVLADFWEIREVDKRYDDYDGVSMIIVYTERGKKLLKSSEKYMKCNEVSLDDVISCKKNLKPRSYSMAGREAFMRDYMTKGYEYAQKKHLEPAAYKKPLKYLKDSILVLLRKK